MRILVVEDDEPIRQLLETLLVEETSHTVITAQNGQQAFDILQQQPIQMVITDWLMEQVDGLELVHRIRKANFADYIFIIVITGKGSKHDLVTALQAGADDYLTKPFDVQELQARVAAGERRIQLEAQLRRSRDEAVAQSRRDGLTGVLNRDAITEQAEAALAQAQRESRPVSVALLDLDHFKEVNDQYGHLVGDDLLVLLTRSLQRALRTGDWIGRWGGDEFLLIFPGTDLDGACAATERLRKHLHVAALPLADGSHLPLSLSIGVATAHAQESLPLRALLQRADEALYRAKHSGKNQICGWKRAED